VARAPADSKALGNLGNALLARGELKKGLCEELAASLAAAGAGAPWQEAEAMGRTLAQLRAEAATLLTSAGELFRRALEAEGWSSRALVNWGRAMCLRAELAEAPEAVEKLYRAAIDKFEAVLEEEPGMVPAKFRCALAMKGLAAAVAAAGGPGGSRAAQAQLLQDAANYLTDVLASDAPDAAALQPAAAEALREAQAAAAALRGG
jgi:hypothetical protein